MPRSHHLTAAEKADLISRYRDGATNKELAAAFAMSSGTVTHYTRGVERSADGLARIRTLRQHMARYARSFGPTLPSKADQSALVAQREQGIPVKKLAKRFGVSASTIYKLARERRQASTTGDGSVHTSAAQRTVDMNLAPKRSTWIPDLLAPLQHEERGMVGQLIAGVRATRHIPNTKQQAIAAAIGAPLASYVEARRLGRVYRAPWCILGRFPPTVLSCEFAFVRATRANVWDGYIPLVPDLVVEVLTPTQRLLDIVDRVDVWLAAGTRLVLIVNLRTRSIALHTTEGATRLSGRQQLHLGDVVPTWRLPLPAIWRSADVAPATSRVRRAP